MSFGANAEVHVRNLGRLQALFKAAGPAASKALRADLADIAEPIRADAESLAASRITRIGSRWARMRTGVTRNAVYVAPRQRGTRRRSDPLSRPGFADLMEERAMTPALDLNKGNIERRVETTFAELAAKWNAEN